MPGYVIHLAIAEEYLEKHKDKAEEHDKFIKGVIFPDGVADKSLTHYGECSSKSNLYNYLQHNDMNESFKRGYFLHLLTDYLFYNKYIETFSKKIVYNDYDILNKGIMDKYNVVIPEEIKPYVFFKNEGKPKILTKELVEKFIEDVSNLDLDIVEKQVKENKEKWTTYRPLKFITSVD